MKVTIRYSNGINSELSKTEVYLEESRVQTIRDVLKLLQTQDHNMNLGDLDLDQRTFLVLVDGIEISAIANLETEITKPCDIAIIPVIHGG